MRLKVNTSVCGLDARCSPRTPPPTRGSPNTWQSTWGVSLSYALWTAVDRDLGTRYNTTRRERFTLNLRIMSAHPPGHVIPSRQLSLQKSPRHSGQLSKWSAETVSAVISNKVLYQEKSPEDTQEQPWPGRGQCPSLWTWPLPCGYHGRHQGRAVKVQLSQEVILILCITWPGPH